MTPMERRVADEAYQEYMNLQSALWGYRITCVLLLIAFGVSLYLHAK